MRLASRSIQRGLHFEKIDGSSFFVKLLSTVLNFCHLMNFFGPEQSF